MSISGMGLGLQHVRFVYGPACFGKLLEQVMLHMLGWLLLGMFMFSLLSNGYNLLYDDV